MNEIFDEAKRTTYEPPTADVVEVVRCKDCKYYKINPYGEESERMCKCWGDYLPTNADDFCSYGERKPD